MNKVILTVIILLIGFGTSAWLIFNIHTKKKYDECRNELIPKVLSVVKMNSETKKLLSEARMNWKNAYNETDGPYTNSLKVVMKNPSVSNLVEIFTYSMPEYSFFAPKLNMKSVKMGSIQNLILPMTIDHQVHLSDNGNLALIKCTPGIILVYSNGQRGLREEMYYKK